MTTFDDRESAFEAKFAHDEEMIFKPKPAPTRNLAFGLPRNWAKPAMTPKLMPAK